MSLKHVAAMAVTLATGLASGRWKATGLTSGCWKRCNALMILSAYVGWDDHHEWPQLNGENLQDVHAPHYMHPYCLALHALHTYICSGGGP